jgi:NHL repeat
MKERIRVPGQPARRYRVGQPDFYSYYCNQTVGDLSPGTSTPAQNTLCNPEGVAVDRSGNVYVSDTGNNRVLVYANPFASLPAQDSNLDAIAVFGQGSTGSSFTTDAAATGQTGLDTPQGIAVDAAGNMFVIAASNNRALEYFDPLGAADPTTGAGDVVADRVFGQTDFSGNQENKGLASSNNTTLSTYGATIDGLATPYGDLYVTDFNNRRVLEYNGFFDSGDNDPAANLVFQQVGKRHNGRWIKYGLYCLVRRGL